MNNLFADPPGFYAGYRVLVLDAQKQARTPRDVPLYWTRPKVPAKASGRRGTRRAWKAKNPPHMVMAYREPTDVLTIARHTMIVTERQYLALRLAAAPDPA